MELGYIRISSVGLNTDRQLAALGLPPGSRYSSQPLEPGCSNQERQVDETSVL